MLSQKIFFKFIRIIWKKIACCIYDRTAIKILILKASQIYCFNGLNFKQITHKDQLFAKYVDPGFTLYQVQCFRWKMLVSGSHAPIQNTNTFQMQKYYQRTRIYQTNTPGNDDKTNCETGILSPMRPTSAR